MISTIPENTVMLLINAIYFKGQWKLQFDESETVDEVFFKTVNSQVTVPMMKKKREFKVYGGNGFRSLNFLMDRATMSWTLFFPTKRRIEQYSRSH
jgi:serpin B